MDTTTQLLASIGIDIGKEVFHVVGFMPSFDENWEGLLKVML